MKLADIKPNTKNPRRISASALEKLKESIQRDPEFMALRPIVVDTDGMILGGNQRYRAIKELGMKDVPKGWIVKAENLTPEQRKRFILVDNAPEGMAGDWDWDVLQQDWEVPELEELGFEVVSDPSATAPPKPITKPADETWIFIRVPTADYLKIARELETIGTHPEVQVKQVFAPIVDQFKIGKANYTNESTSVDWHSCFKRMKAIADKKNLDVYWKKDFLAFA